LRQYELYIECKSRPGRNEVSRAAAESHKQNGKQQQQIESRGEPRVQSTAALPNRKIPGGTLRIDSV
jgi:hypothetical protein